MEDKSFFKKTETLKAMHFIAVMMVGFFLGITIYQNVEINIQLGKNLIQGEQYERLITSNQKELSSLVMIVVMYFFGRETGKATEHEKNKS